MSYPKTAEGRAANATRMRTYRAANLVKMRAQETARRRPEVQRAYQLRLRYGITQAQYDALLVAQDGRCKACGRPETAIGNGGRVKPLAVDHDHGTGEVRGLLCQECNLILGLADDDIERLLALADYLNVEALSSHPHRAED